MTGCPTLHFAQLVFFEVGRDPDVVEVDDLHQLLSGRNILSDFDGAIADDPAHWRDNFCVLQIELGLVEFSFFRIGLGLRGLRPRTDHCQLLRCRIGLPQTSLRLIQFGLRLHDRSALHPATCAFCAATMDSLAFAEATA